MFLPSLIISTESADKKYAEILCIGDKNVLSDFLELYSDVLYYISSKFNNRGIKQEAWEYRTKKGYTIQVSDDVADTYCWLIKIAQNKSCLYRGDRGASFKTYIISVLNSNYTFKDWLKWKTGITGYVPKCIKKLGDNYREVFLLLKQKKSAEYIIRKKKIYANIFYKMYLEIESVLIESNQINLIQDIVIVPIDNQQNGNSNQSGKDINDPNLEIKYLPDVQLILTIIKRIMGELSSAERRLLLLYWGENLSIDDIFNTFSTKPFRDYLESLELKKPKDIYSSITNITNKAFLLGKKEFSHVFEDYKINMQIMRRLLKTFLQNFEL